MKIFVYMMNTDERRLAFVEEERLAEFTLKAFKADVFEFTGVCIEAPTLNAARLIYDNPVAAPEGCEYMIADEPYMTAQKRSVQRSKSKISTTVAQHAMVYHIRQVNMAISKTARMIHAGSNTILTEEQIYTALKSKVVTAIAGMPYERKGTEPGPDDTPTTGSPA